MNRILMIIISLSLLVMINAVFIVSEQNQALVVQFGEVVRFEKEPGLKFKIPLIQEVKLFEKRTLNIIAEEKEIIAKDQKRLITSAFAKYKITDPLKFYQSLRSENVAQSRLISVLDSALRQIIGEFPLASLLSDKRAEIMDKIAIKFNNQAKDFGVQIIDVRLMRTDLPEKNSQGIFTRMQTDREKEARELRAEGEEQAQMITSLAEKERAIILAEAEQKSQKIKGDGDAIASKTYAEVFGQDPEFFEFYHIMTSYKKSFKGDNTQIILSPDNEFLKYMKKYK